MPLDLTNHPGAALNNTEDQPEGYIVDENDPDDQDLVAAANAAIVLGKPLLLTGEPGIGKSEFAGWVAHQYGIALHRFVVKSTTDATDLFYQFDALARFRDAQVESLRPLGMTLGAGQSSAAANAASHSGVDVTLHRYLRYNALGTAILHSLGQAAAATKGFISASMGADWYRSFPLKPVRSVVLIDEIDKAPRDVPNDVLDEILNRRFRVRELENIEAQAEAGLAPIVVITSNSERDLPKAFLRRCIYHHMRLPDATPDLEKVLFRIAQSRVIKRFASHKSLLGDCVRLFAYVRAHAGLKHQPGLAELLDWLSAVAIQTLAASGARALDKGDEPSFKGAVLKESSDHQRAEKEWDNWLAKSRN